MLACLSSNQFPFSYDFAWLLYLKETPFLYIFSFIFHNSRPQFPSPLYYLRNYYLKQILCTNIYVPSHKLPTIPSAAPWILHNTSANLVLAIKTLIRKLSGIIPFKRNERLLDFLFSTPPSPRHHHLQHPPPEQSNNSRQADQERSMIVNAAR